MSINSENGIEKPVCDVSWLSEEKLEELLHPKSVSSTQDQSEMVSNFAASINQKTTPVTSCQPYNRANEEQITNPNFPQIFERNCITNRNFDEIEGNKSFNSNRTTNTYCDYVSPNEPFNPCIKPPDNLREKNFRSTTVHNRNISIDNYYKPLASKNNCDCNEFLPYSNTSVPLNQMKPLENDYSQNYQQKSFIPRCSNLRNPSISGIEQCSFRMPMASNSTTSTCLAYYSPQTSNPIYSHTLPNVNLRFSNPNIENGNNFSCQTFADLKKGSVLHNVPPKLIDENDTIARASSVYEKSTNPQVGFCSFNCYATYTELKKKLDEAFRLIAEDRKIITLLMENYSRLLSSSTKPVVTSAHDLSPTVTVSKCNRATLTDVTSPIDNEEKGTNTTFFFDPDHRVPDLALFENNMTTENDNHATVMPGHEIKQMDNAKDGKDNQGEDAPSPAKCVQSIRPSINKSIVPSSSTRLEKDVDVEKDVDSLKEMYQRAFDATTEQLRRLGVNVSNSLYDISPSKYNYPKYASVSSDSSEISNLALKYLSNTDMVDELGPDRSFTQNMSINTRNYFEKYGLFPRTYNEDDSNGSGKNGDRNTFWIFN